MALFKHDQCGCGSELYAEHLKLVNAVPRFSVAYWWISLPSHLDGISFLVCIQIKKFSPFFQVIPILGFIQHCEATWMRILQLENDSKKFSENNQFSVQSCEGRFYNLSVRKILRGKDIGILLLGNLKVGNLSLWCIILTSL